MDIETEPETTERKLNWIPRHDERSRDYPIRMMVADRPDPVTKMWRLETWLDQGREGACVGFAWSHELAAEPDPIDTTADFAFNVYTLAKTLDEWEGEMYDGTSVLAGAKALQRMGNVFEYRWAFGLDDVLASLSYYGPVVLGVPWYQGMRNPDSRGYICVRGSQVGGHAICAIGVNVEESYLTLHNSWGRYWGSNGTCKISFDDMATLLARQGEACIPVRSMAVAESEEIVTDTTVTS